MAETLIKINNLSKLYPLKKNLFRKAKEWLPALHNISFDINEGEVFGLVGESGSGKSTCGKILVRLEKATSGQVFFEGTEINSLKGRDLKAFRKKAQMIFQDPYESLNPRRTVFDTLIEPLNVHTVYEELAEPLKAQHIGSRDYRERKIQEVLEKVELKPVKDFLYRYPHELSGGQRQRISIARALVLDPKFIVADEPISMLDASVRASFMNLMLKLKKDFNLTYLFISHDLASARYICDRLGVLFQGEIVEIGPTERIIQDPKHPYTKMLLSAVPVADPKIKRKRLEGAKMAPIEHSTGCVACKFYTRCPIASKEKCGEGKPELVSVEDGRFVSCHHIK